MFKEYILGQEISSKGNIKIDNISILISKLTEDIDYVKIGATTMIHKKSRNLPNYIERIIKDNTFSDLSGYIPLTLFTDMLEGHLTMLKDLYDIKEIGSYKTSNKTIKGKLFVFVKDENLRKVLLDDNTVKYVSSKKELPSIQNLIDGKIQISASKYLTWYK